MAPWFVDARQTCANSTRGTSDSDFTTICCDGDIIDTKFDLFRSSRGKSIDLADLVCCRIQGAQTGGLLPLPTNTATECASGTPVPLVSLAATNTQIAQGYLVTYTSASFGTGTTGDFIPTETPYCLWALTKGVSVTNVTVPAAQITSLSSSEFRFGWGSTVSGGRTSTRDTSSIPSTNSARSGSSTSAESRATSTLSSLGSTVAVKDMLLLAALCLGAQCFRVLL
jgi:hypothetical protein